MSFEELDTDCPMCGELVPEKEAEMTAADMEFDAKTCVTCGQNFSEIREEMFGEDDE